MRGFRPWLTLALLPLLLGTGPRAQVPGEDLCARTMAALTARYRDLTFLEANFRHGLTSKILGQEEVETGILYLAKGGRMRWDYSAPKGKLAVADGKTSYLYLPSENEVFVQPLKAGADAPLALRLLSGEVDLAREVTCTAASRSGDLVLLDLTLKTPQPDVNGLQIAVDAERGFVRAVRYEDSLGNAVSLELTDIRVPSALPASLFAFTPPEGAKVLRSQ